MKLLVTTKGNTSKSKTDDRFGRCEYFCIFNSENGTYDFIINEAKEMPQGAGPKAAQKAIDLGVEVIITGDLGPKAKMVIDATTIKAYKLQSDDIEETLTQFNHDLLKQIVSPGNSHKGMR